MILNEGFEGNRFLLYIVSYLTTSFELQSLEIAN